MWTWVIPHRCWPLPTWGFSLCEARANPQIYGSDEVSVRDPAPSRGTPLPLSRTELVSTPPAWVMRGAYLFELLVDDFADLV